MGRGIFLPIEGWPKDKPFPPDGANRLLVALEVPQLDLGCWIRPFSGGGNQ